MREREAMRALLKENPTKREQEACIATIKEVQKTDVEAQTVTESASLFLYFSNRTVLQEAHIEHRETEP